MDYSPPVSREGGPPAEEDDRLWKVVARPEDDRLWRLATAKKALIRANAAPATAKAADVAAYVGQLADSVLDAHQAGRMTLVIVNRVTRAQALHAALGKRLKKQGEAAPELALVHARFRPADRWREMGKLPVNGKEDGESSKDLIVVSTQAVEAGVDVSAAVLFTELAPWPSMVQRFGRANRYAELEDGADVRWIDLLDGQEDDKDAADLALPYAVEEMNTARQHLLRLADVAPAALPPPGDVDPPAAGHPPEGSRRSLSTPIQISRASTWTSHPTFATPPTPTSMSSGAIFPPSVTIHRARHRARRAGELCAVPIGAAREWLKKVGKREKGNAPVFVRDPQWRREDRRTDVPPGWMRLRGDPWPGLTLLVGVAAGGYREASGFTGDPADVPNSIPSTEAPVTSPEEQRTTTTEVSRGLPSDIGGDAEGYGEDTRSELGVPVSLSAHLGHVAQEAEVLCDALEVDSKTRTAIVRAARWHDLGKAHRVFQNTMRRGLEPHEFPDDVLLAKTTRKNLRHEQRPYFRHELASALAFLAHEKWSREADLVAYLVAAHHGKVRMNLRALPRERAPSDEDRIGTRFARGVWEGDELRSFDLGGGERWEGGGLALSVMELGWDEETRESWTERTRDLLARFGPFRLAWMETLVRVADWRASEKEREGRYDDT